VRSIVKVIWPASELASLPLIVTVVSPSVVVVIGEAQLVCG
jgi:hypothetical protein